MKQFSELLYERPDFKTEKEAVKKYASDIMNAQSPEELAEIFQREDQRSRHMWTMYDLAYIRNTIDTTDSFYEGEMNAFYEEMGELSLLYQKAESSILQSPFRKGIEERFGALILQRMEMNQNLVSTEVVDDMELESGLCQEYNRLVASCVREFHGETCNFAKLSKFMQDADRKVRKEAFHVWASMYESIAGRLDDIYGKMIEVRSRIAEQLGFESYIPYIYARFGRTDYGPEDISRFRGFIREKIVPVCEKLYREQARKLGLDSLEYYDESLKNPEGNANPCGTKEEMLKNASLMYHELSKETGEFFDFMIKYNMFDLDSRPGKQPGGYCAFLSEVKSPFIFANFNGTSADVDVLTHEMGHAFEAYTASRIYPLSSMMWASNEINETHSMSMEFLTYPWMDKFFGDRAEEYRRNHLAQALEAIPFMVCVDEFQHKVFEHKPDAMGRRRIWHELEQVYMPWRKYDGNEFFESGGYWMQRQHIFINPFYYVDYALAQMGAFQFYRMMDADPEKAWQEYYRLCRSGGSRGYFETMEYAGISNPFQQKTIQEIVDFLKPKLFL